MSGAHLKVVQPGLFSSIQDLGRWGAQNQGISVSGAMDSEALRLANRLVGNPDGFAAVEMALIGPELTASADALVALTGANMRPHVDGEHFPSFAATILPAGRTLKFRNSSSGCHGYLAVAGGVDVPPVLGSRSTYVRAGIGGIAGKPLAAGDTLPIGEPRFEAKPPRTSLRRFIRPFSKTHTVRVVLGPQDDAFTERGLSLFLSASYKISPKSDRTGLRLEGPSIPFRNGADIISEAVTMGAIQVTANGSPILMMADRNTTGGYAKIATVITVDLSVCAQIRPHDQIEFRAVSVAEAQDLAHRRRHHLDSILPSFSDEEAISCVQSM
jgi:antagonist of KipI